MSSNETTSHSSQVYVNSCGRGGYARRGYTRQGSMIDLVSNNDDMVLNNNENDEHAEEHQERLVCDDEQQWIDDETDEEEQDKARELTFDHCVDQDEEEEMLVDQGSEYLQGQRNITRSNTMSGFQGVVSKCEDRKAIISKD